jgi:RNA polymerase sigma factor (sigma-70 family)
VGRTVDKVGMIRDMDLEESLDTATSFVVRLSHHDPQAWEDFAVHYSRMMRRWMKPWKIPVDEVEDILQDTYLRILGNVHRFRHRGPGTFRAWLKKVSRSCWLKVVQQSAFGKHTSLDVEASLSEETMLSIDREIDLLIEKEYFQYALECTRRRVNSQLWDAYRLTAIEGRSGQEAAGILSVSVDVIYKSRSRFQERLAEALQELASERSSV